MHDDSGNSGNAEKTPNPAGARRRYEKPAFRHESVFETMALACGKIKSTQAQCKVLLKNS